MNLQSRMMIVLSTTLTLLLLLLCISNLPTTAHAYPRYAHPTSTQATGTTTTPTVALRINGGALATTVPTVTLSLSATSPISPVTAVRLSSASDFSDSWQQYTETMTYTLPVSDGMKTVYAQVRDDAGTVSPIVSDSIRLDTAPGVTPSVFIRDDATWTTTTDVTLTVGAPPGTTAMQIRNDANFTDTDWLPFDTQPAWTIVPTQTATVYLRLRGVDATLGDSINYDAVAPTGSVTISATTPHTVQLALAAHDAYSGVNAMRVGTYDEFVDTEWQEFTHTVTVSRLTASDTAPRVAAQFRDTAGNLSRQYTTGEWNVFVPLVSKDVASVDVCAPIEGESYAAITPDTPYPDGDPPPDQHPDLNLSVRGYEPSATAFRGLVDYDGDTDSKAPQLYGLFADERTPTFSTQYQVYDWLWEECDCRGELLTNFPVTLSGMQVTPGEPIHVPPSGYSIGTLSDAYEVLVLYASQKQIVLKYTRNDDVIQGYTVKVEGVCVEPRLLELYNQWHDAGRTRLPALRAGQAFGRARSEEIRVAIRDNGTFMDPRSRKDWWQGRQAAFNIPREHVPAAAVDQ